MRKLTSAATVAGLIVGLIGLLNLVLGAEAVISGAFPGAEGRLLAPAIGVGSIVFGLAMLIAGALWVTSGVGYFIRKEWASTLALYVSPVIVGINLAGALHLWGFDVHIGWAVLSTVAGVGSIWYLSKKELASFFIIAVAEHVVVLLVFAMLIYAEPLDVAEPEHIEVTLTEEQALQEEPLPVEIIPRERAVLEKPPILPKIEIRNVTATDPGIEIEDSVPQLPRTYARVMDTGTDTVLRSPGPKDREQRYQDTRPALDVESALESSKKPSLEIGPSEKVKEGAETTVARPPEHIRDDISSPDERLGPSKQVARPGFVGEISGKIAGRKVASWPKPPEGLEGTEGGSAVVELSVNPVGHVIRAKVIKKSGNPRLDRMAEELVKQIRFEELPRNVTPIVQSGEILINFELTRGTG